MSEFLVRNISKHDYLEISLYSNHYDPVIDKFSNESRLTYKIIKAPYPLYEQILLPIRSRLDGINIFHYFGNTGSIFLRPAKISIITICDTIFWDESFISWLRKRKYGNAYRNIVTKLQAKLNYNYTFISKYTESCFLNKYSLKNKSKVVYISGGVDKAEFRDDNLQERYLCAMGADDPRKNTHLTIKTFISAQIFRNFNIKLKVFGLQNPADFTFSHGYCKEYLESHGVTITGYATENQKLRLMKNSMGFIYLSQNEGFGIPIVEAEKLGKICLVSSTTSCIEIVSPFSFTVDPADEVAVQYALSQYCFSLLESHKDVTLKLKIIKHANKFSWANTAEEMLKFYDKLISERLIK